jgi:hypothetical protein
MTLVLSTDIMPIQKFVYHVEMTNIFVSVGLSDPVFSSCTHGPCKVGRVERRDKHYATMSN